MSTLIFGGNFEFYKYQLRFSFFSYHLAFDELTSLQLNFNLTSIQFKYNTLIVSQFKFKLTFAKLIIMYSI